MTRHCAWLRRSEIFRSRHCQFSFRSFDLRDFIIFRDRQRRMDHGTSRFPESRLRFRSRRRGVCFSREGSAAFAAGLAARAAPGPRSRNAACGGHAGRSRSGACRRGALGPSPPVGFPAALASPAVLGSSPPLAPPPSLVSSAQALGLAPQAALGPSPAPLASPFLVSRRKFNQEGSRYETDRNSVVSDFSDIGCRDANPSHAGGTCAAGPRRDNIGGARLRPGLSPRTLRCVPPAVQLSARLAFGSVRTPLLPQLINDVRAGEISRPFQPRAITGSCSELTGMFTSQTSPEGLKIRRASP